MICRNLIFELINWWILIYTKAKVMKEMRFKISLAQRIRKAWLSRLFGAKPEQGIKPVA
jgi:hypothetical protein